MKLTPPNITPGPWSSYNRLVESPHVFVAKCHNLTDEEHCGDTEANARAIAATPDTLAALAELAQGFVNREVVRRYGEKPADMTDPEFVRLISADAWGYAFLKNARAALLKAGYKIEE